MSVVTTEAHGFRHMPLSAQALWFHLALRADREGCLQNSTAGWIADQIGASEEDKRLLMLNKFLKMERGQIVVNSQSVYDGLAEIEGDNLVKRYFWGNLQMWQEKVRKYDAASRMQLRTESQWGVQEE